MAGRIASRDGGGRRSASPGTAPRGDAGAPAVRRVVLAVFAGALLLSASWALTSPLMFAPDEASHTIRAVSLWQGDLLGRRFQIVEEGPPRVEAVNFAVTIPAGYSTLPELTPCFQDLARPAGCSPPFEPRPGTAVLGTSAGAYQPLWYGVLGAPSRLLPPVDAVYGGRLLHALAGAAFLAATAGFAWVLTGRAGVLLAVLGTTPTSVFLLGSINPNGVEIAAASTLWFAALVMFRDPGHRWAAVAVGVSAASVAWTRPLSPAITAGILIAAAAVAATPATLRRLRHSPTAVAALAAALVAIASSLAWVVWSGALDTFIGRPDPALTPGVAAVGSLLLTPHRLDQMVGRFGLVNVFLPEPVLWSYALVVVVAVVAAARVGSVRQKAILAALVVATVTLPVLAEALTAADLGYTWQGRYTMPVTWGVLAVAALARADHRDRPPGRAAAGAAAVAVVLAHVAGHLQAIADVSGGRGAALLDHLDGAAWAPPAPGWVLLGLTALGAALMAWPAVGDPVRGGRMP